MEFSRLEYWSGSPFPSPGNLPNPGIKPRSPTLQVDYLPAKLQGKPKGTRVDSLSLLQWIFPTQNSNQRLLHFITIYTHGIPLYRASLMTVGKESACSAGDTGDMGSIPGLGRSTGGGNGNPLHHSCLKAPMDRGAWWATVHEVTKSRIWLSMLSGLDWQQIEQDRDRNQERTNSLISETRTGNQN